MKHSLMWTVKTKTLELWLAIASVSFGVYFFYYLRSTSWAKAQASAINNPAFFPELVAKAILIIGVVLLILAVFNKNITSTITVNLWSFVVLCVLWAYLILMPYLGFILSSMLVVAASMILWGGKSKKIILLCSVTAPVFLYLVLGVGLKVRFPTLL